MSLRRRSNSSSGPLTTKEANNANRGDGNTKKKPRTRTNTNNITYFGGEICKYPVVHTAFKSLKYKSVGENASQERKNNCNVYWIDTSNINEYYKLIRPWQRINHFMGMANIARKSRLAQNLGESNCIDDA